MRTTGSRSAVLYLLAIGFLAGLCVFLYGFLFQGGNWAMQSFNRHLTGDSQLTAAGKIYDRNGVVLAKSENGKRLYNSDEEIRRAMLHTVGDTNGYISTGVQYSYRSQMGGYNLLTGLTVPTGKPSGSDITLTLDSALCKTAYEKMGGYNGAAALYNYKTGQILCMVSKPGIDPANVPKDIDTNPKYEGAYLNRVLSSSYTPGSIFKLVTSAAAIENIPDIYSRTFHCSGSITVNGNKITCTEAHGDINFRDGLAKSCNIVFAELAMELGKDKMTAEANQMGFNNAYQADGIKTAKSIYDVSKAEENDLGWSGIGQYTDLTNPYHMMMLMGAIANGGVPVQPYFIGDIKTSFGLSVKKGETRDGARMVKESTAAALKDMMRYNVTSDYGDSMFPGLKVCAKTGTAEVGNGKKPNGWMVGFSSDPKTPYAFAVVIEQGNYGRTSAGKIASAIMAQAAKRGK